MVLVCRYVEIEASVEPRPDALVADGSRHLLHLLAARVFLQPRQMYTCDTWQWRLPGCRRLLHRDACSRRLDTRLSRRYVLVEVEIWQLCIGITHNEFRWLVFSGGKC